MRSHRQVAMHLDALGLRSPTSLPARIWRTSWPPETIREEGTIAAPAGQGRVGWVAARDVAAVAAQVLTSPGHDGAMYVVTGPEALGYADVAAGISTVFARQVDYEDQPAKRARELMLASGMSPWEADSNFELFEWIRDGGAATVTDTVHEVTGAAPQPIQDWLSDSRELRRTAA